MHRHTQRHMETHKMHTHTDTYKKMHREAHNTHIQKTYGTDTKIERDTHTRVESRLDDLDYLGHLGHFFGGLSGSHPQTT